MQIERPNRREIENDNRKLTSPYQTTWAMFYGDHVRKYRIRIEEGFVWKPTVPTPVAKWVVPPKEIMTASLPHDWMYRYRGNLHPYDGKLEIWRPEAQMWDPKTQVTKIFADKVFYRFMQMENVSPWRSSVAYYTVRSPIGQVVWDEPPSDDEIQN